MQHYTSLFQGKLRLKMLMLSFLLLLPLIISAYNSLRIESIEENMTTATSRLICLFCRMIHEAHKHTVTIGGHRIHALLQSTFEVSLGSWAVSPQP